MFYDEQQAITSCIDEPSLVFELINEGFFDIVDKLLSKHKIDINVCDKNGNDILVRLLRAGAYNIVLENMSNKDWNINHQNKDGNTFAHYLVSINYVNVIDIISNIKKNKDF